VAGLGPSRCTATCAAISAVTAVRRCRAAGYSDTSGARACEHAACRATRASGGGRLLRPRVVVVADALFGAGGARTGRCHAGPPGAAVRLRAAWALAAVRARLSASVRQRRAARGVGREYGTGAEGFAVGEVGPA